MSLLKIVVLIIVGTVVVFSLLLYIALSPTIRNVSARAGLKPLLNKKLTLKRKAFIYYCEGTFYKFEHLSIKEDEEYPCEKKFELEPGTSLIIREFKTYKNAVSGFTSLFALGTVELEGGERLDIEYDCGSTDLDQLAGKEPVLRDAIWEHNLAKPN